MDVGQARFPHITVMDRQFLTIPAVSATTERVFNFTGLTLRWYFRVFSFGGLTLRWYTPLVLFYRVVAKWHVRVSKQSCKQANRLILWGVGAPRHFLFWIFL